MSGGSSDALLLDSCAVIWIANGNAMSPSSLEAIGEAAAKASLFVSPITAWEIGVLMAKGRMRAPLAPDRLMERFMRETNAQYCELSAGVLIDSSFLPGEPHGDPADRIIIAAARQEGLAIVTRDRAILDYAAAGYALALEC